MDSPDADAAPRRRGFSLGRMLRDQLRNIAPFATLLILVGFFSFSAPAFATLGNLVNILQQASVTGIIAVGLTFVILTAEIDLSVGAIANATAIVLTKELRMEFRARELLSTTVVFALVVVVLFSFAFDPTAGESRRYGPGLLWIAFLFSGSLMLNPSFAREQCPASGRTCRRQ